MDYTKPIVKIDLTNYDYIVSLGNKCPTAIALNNIGVYKESFPFDYISSTAGLVLKYLKDRLDFLPHRYSTRNKDGCWFGHFDFSKEYEKTAETFNRRFERLFNALENKKRILFVYTSEADVYNEQGNRYLDNYKELCLIVKYLENTYHYSDFKILAVHVNKTFKDTDNIVNYKIDVPEKYLSDDRSTHVAEVYTKYRNTLIALFKDIFN